MNISLPEALKSFGDVAGRGYGTSSAAAILSAAVEFDPSTAQPLFAVRPYWAWVTRHMVRQQLFYGCPWLPASELHLLTPDIENMNVVRVHRP
jgi:hypothetical protein